MALMTSSSGTSSAPPAKLVSRRFRRMARSLSALPRRALMSCRRSRSFRGRKSMDSTPLRETKKTRRLRPAAEILSPSFAAGQLREKPVHAAVHPVVVDIDRERLAAAQDAVEDLFL